MSPEVDSRLRTARCCVLVPTYNNAPFLPLFLAELVNATKEVVVVNDGSTDDTAAILSEYESEITVIHHNENRGKGIALRTGFAAAWEKGYQYAITIDSDGQHLISDIPAFLHELEKHPGSAIVGARNMEQEGVPGKSSFGNRFSNFWYFVETFIKLPDTQSGYRLYPLEPISKMKFFTYKYEFEIEVLVRLAWQRVPVRSVPVSVVYHDAQKRISHFRPFVDFFRISVLNTFLVLIAYLYIHPRNFLRALTWQNIRLFFDRNLFRTGASNKKLATEIGFGFFMGIVPIWGYQMIAAVFLSHWFRLNKVVVLLAANISLPPVMPFIIYGSYLLGGTVVDTTAKPLSFDTEFSLAAISGHLLQYLVGAVMLAVAAGVLGGLFFYLVFVLFRKKAENA